MLVCFVSLHCVNASEGNNKRKKIRQETKMKGRLEGRVAIVTGGGHDIGKAYATRPAAEGANSHC
jgi:hypothetical protein